MSSPAAERFTLSDFDYDLPPELIAQEPAPLRDRSRLLVLDRRTGAVDHQAFPGITGLLRPGDLLVLNDTRVFPCRITATKSGGGRAEVFLLEEQALNRWRALVRGIDRGRKAAVGPGVDVEVLHDAGDGVKEVRFHGTEDIRSLLPEMGRVPLPPYIKREPSDRDRERYQTVFARHDGAVAAPTAGLHFTEDLLQALRTLGAETVFLTLHVGPGTFQPVRTDAIEEHRMHHERYAIPEGTAARIDRARREGGRVICVGTTSVRALETAVRQDGTVRPGAGTSDLFIRPGFRFRVADGLITNFHLPKSTLLMLVTAFAGHERVMAAYRTAVRERYRFYSYGDAMCIL